MLWFQKLANFFDQPVFYPDEYLRQLHIPAGLLLIACGGWLISLSLNFFGLVAAATGLLYLFFPGWYAPVAGLTDRRVLSIDNLFSSGFSDLSNKQIRR